MLVVFDMESEKTFANAVGIRKQHSAMNPILWLVGIAGTLCGVIFHSPSPPEWAKWIAMGLFCVAVASAIGIYIFFAVKKPECLRSEQYHVTHDVLSYCERTQANPEIVVKTISTTVNPKLEDKTE